MGSPVHNTVLELTPISTVRRRIRELLNTHCSETERRWLSDMPVQTVAGQIALKRALTKLYEETQGEPAPTPDRFEIVRSETGAPQLHRIDDCAASPYFVAHVEVSISHTRDTAAGLAVFKGEET